MVRRQAGYTLMEVVMAMAIFGFFIIILVMMTADMMQYEKRYPVNFMTHPQVMAVLARLRRDVEDATPPYYKDKDRSGTWSMGPKTLVLEVLKSSGFTVEVIWDFSRPGEVHRHEINVGVDTEWMARGLPAFVVDDFPIAGKPDSVRIQATDSKGQLAIDQIYQPRPH